MWIYEVICCQKMAHVITFSPAGWVKSEQKYNFCCIADSELARRLACATSIMQLAASAPAWRGHQEQIETAFSTRVLNGCEDDRTVNNSYQESNRFLCLWYGEPSALQQTQCGSVSHTVKRWIKAGGVELKEKSYGLSKVCVIDMWELFNYIMWKSRP